MKIKASIKGLLTAAVAIAWCVAMAVEVTVDTTVPLTADSDTDYAIADGVTLTIEVVGMTNTLSGCITGTGTAKLRKTGLGALVLSNANNSVPGGIFIDEGQIRADVQGCLGEGPIAIAQGRTTQGGVWFNAQDATFDNDFSLSGDGYVKIGSASYYDYAISTYKNVTLNGSVTSTGITCFENYPVDGTKGANRHSTTYNGDITLAAGKHLVVRTYGTNVFNGAITASYCAFGTAASNTGDVYLNNPRNRFAYSSTYRPNIYCGDTNVLREAYVLVSKNCNRPAGYHALNLQGHDQRVNYFSNASAQSSTSAGTCPITSDRPCTLTLVGNYNGTRYSGHILNGAVSLVVDAENSKFVQCFTNAYAGVTTTHTTTGTVTVKRGTLQIRGDMTSFSGLPQMTVEENGTLHIDTLGQIVFPVATNFTVKGALTIAADADAPFTPRVTSLTLDEGASFTVNTAVKSVFSQVYVQSGGSYAKLEAGDYDYPDERVPQLKAGGFTVAGSGATDPTWEGEMVFTPQNTEVVIMPYAEVDQKVVSFAAREMTNFLSRAFGAAVPVKNVLDPNKFSIVLGSNSWSLAAGIDTANLPQDGFVIRTKGNAVYIAGLDENKDPGTRDESFARATLFGVYEFLEKYVGCRFYFPGELGEIVPRIESFSVPETNVVSAPVFTERHFTTSIGEWYDPDFSVKRYATLSKLRLRMQSRSLHCAHGLREFKYVQRFGETHPEYFLMKSDGTRDIMDTGMKPYHKNNKFCYSSQGFKEEVYQDVKAYLTGLPPESRGLEQWGGHCYYGAYVDIMPEDGTVHCYCPDCTAAYAVARDPECESDEIIWDFTIDIAERLTREGINGNVMQMAYSTYKNVPERAMPGNIYVSVCNNGGWVSPERAEIDYTQMRAWFDKVGKVKLYNNCGKFESHHLDFNDVPTPTPRAMARFYNRMAPMARGAYCCNAADRAMYCMLNWYVFSRVAWYGSVDVDALLEEYYRFMFGAAAAPMQAFFEELERKWMEEVIGARYETGTGTVVATIPEYRVWAELYSQEKCNALAALVDRAEALVPPDSMEARRIALMRREILDPMARRSGKNWYVDPVNGLDTLDGTTSNIVSETTGPRRTLEKAMELVRDGDTLCLLPGEYREGSMRGGRARIYVTNNITVKSTDGASRTFIVGVNGSPAMSCAHVTNGLERVVFEGLTFRDARAYGWGRFVDDGGGLKSESLGDVTWAIDCVFTNCYAAIGGGMYGGNAYRCRFVDCRARDGGGFAAYSSAFAFCLIQGCSDASCSAYKSYSQKYSPRFYNCTFCGGEGKTFDTYSATSSETVTLCNSIVVGYDENGVRNLYATNCVLGATTLSAEVVNCVSNVSVKASGLVAPERGDVRVTTRSAAANRGEASLLGDVGIPTGYSLSDLLGRPVPASGPIAAGCVQETVERTYGLSFSVR